MSRRAAALLAVLFLIACPVRAQQPPSELVEKGRLIFDSTCSGCHGYDGEGQGELGFKLSTGDPVAWTDDEIVNKIRYGALEKGMPRFADIFLDEGRMTDFGNYTEPIDFNALVAYLRELQSLAAERDKRRSGEVVAPLALPGADAAAGRALFFGKAHCAECHSVRGRGGETAPDLARIAWKYSRDQIYEAIVAPSRTIHPDFRLKELVFARGRKVTGLYRNETSVSIEVYDSSDRSWKTYDKGEVQFYRPLRKSRMPEGLLDALTEREESELLAFLESLRE